MLDPTPVPQGLSSSPRAEADPSTQRRRLLMLARGAAYQMQAHLSRSGGGMQGLVVKQLAQQGVSRVESQLRANSDAQTLALTRFLQRITRAVSASDYSDDDFIREFEAALAEIGDAFSEPDDAA